MAPSEPSPAILIAVKRILDGVARLCLLVAGIQLVVLISIFGWLVYGRYVLNNTPTWVEQMALLLVVYITFLGAAVGVRHNTHLGVEFIRDAMPRSIRLAFGHLADAAVAVFGVFMAWQGWLLVSTNLRRAIPMIGLSESWRAAPLVICGALMVLFSLARIGARLIGQETEEG